jgi:hypothetical protein
MRLRLGLRQQGTALRAASIPRAKARGFYRCAASQHSAWLLPECCFAA